MLTDFGSVRKDASSVPGGPFVASSAGGANVDSSPSDDCCVRTKLLSVVCGLITPFRLILPGASGSHDMVAIGSTAEEDRDLLEYNWLLRIRTRSSPSTVQSKTVLQSAMTQMKFRFMM